MHAYDDQWIFLTDRTRKYSVHDTLRCTVLYVPCARKTEASMCDFFHKNGVRVHA